MRPSPCSTWGVLPCWCKHPVARHGCQEYPRGRGQPQQHAAADVWPAITFHIFFFWLFSNKFLYSAKSKLCVLRANSRYFSILCLAPRKESPNCSFCELVPGSQQDPGRAGSRAQLPLHQQPGGGPGLRQRQQQQSWFQSLPCHSRARGLDQPASVSSSAK